MERIRRCSKVPDLTDLDETWVDSPPTPPPTHPHNNQVYNFDSHRKSTDSQDGSSYSYNSSQLNQSSLSRNLNQRNNNFYIDSESSTERKSSLSSSLKNRATSLIHFLRKGAEQNAVACEPNAYQFRDWDNW